MEKPYVYKLLIYPIKSLDPQEVSKVKVVEKGSLEHDREFALFTEEGKVVSAKKEPKLHRIRSFVDFGNEIFKFKYEGKEYLFSFSEEKKISDFFSEILGYRVYLRRNKEGGFPDDTKAHGPTVVSRETLREVGTWFGLDEEETTLRFRPNIVVANTEPFWEDKLVGREFYIGDVLVKGEKISKRCPVPTRNPFTGEVYPNFVKKFLERREKYILCLNTNIPQSEWGKEIKLKDEVK